MVKKLLGIVLILGFLLTFPLGAHAWRLVWDVPTGGGAPDGYLVEISTDDGASWSYLYGTDTNELPLDDKCNFNTTYMFRVSAFNSAGVSAPTGPLTWTRPAYVPPQDVALPSVNPGPEPVTNTSVTE